MKRISFDDLQNADLFVDAVYESNGAKNLSGDVLNRLMSVGNQGGFRKLKSSRGDSKLAYVVLESTKKHPDWIDGINFEEGIIQYYGDNREPGCELHDTKQGGNKILREIFEKIQTEQRMDIPPFFYFESEEGRNRKFIGLLVPGSDKLKQEELLTAIWRIKNGERYQNYKAYFTILDVAKISREWIKDLQCGNGYESIHAPSEWKHWIDNGLYKPLQAKDSVIKHRTSHQQKPASDNDKQKLRTLYNYFDTGYAFEECAMKIVQLMDKNIHSMEHTRLWRDGGRDALGKYRIGSSCDGIDVEFALEAKRYAMKTSVKVKDVSRLISRLRHRQFGILVTTSYVDSQAYKEIKEDDQPVIIISGGDIIKILYEAGIKTNAEIQDWLSTNFSK